MLHTVRRNRHFLSLLSDLQILIEEQETCFPVQEAGVPLMILVGP